MNSPAPILSNHPTSLHLEHALLPWEDALQFRAFHQRLLDDLSPHGAAEILLVDQIAWAEWRRRRIMLAERSLHLETLNRRSETRGVDTLAQQALVNAPLREREISAAVCIRTSAEDDIALLEDHREDEAETRAALERLEVGGAGAYDEALALLREDTRDWWAGVLEDDEPIEGNRADRLKAFLERDVLAWLDHAMRNAGERSQVRRHAWGVSLDAIRTERLHALDERLQRQIQKALAGLHALQERRQNRAQTGHQSG